MRSKRLTALLAGICVLPLIGCGGERLAEVTGQVTLRNQPLSSGVVNFFPENGVPKAAFVANGSYTIPDAGYGNYRISVTPKGEESLVPTGGSGRPLKPGEFDPEAKTTMPAGKKSNSTPIPDRYQSVDTSRLTCTVDRSKVDYPITLD